MIATGVHAGNLGAMPYRVDQCENCHGDYVRLVPWQKFCCKACRNEFHYYDNRERRKAYQRDYRAYLKSAQPVKLSKADLARALQDALHENAALHQEVSDLKREVGELRNDIRELTQALKSRPTSDAPTPRPPADYVEPELEITRTEGDGGKSAANFMRSLIAIQTSAKPHVQMQVPVIERTPGGLKKLAGGDTAFEVPDFGDLEF